MTTKATIRRTSGFGRFGQIALAVLVILSVSWGIRYAMHRTQIRSWRIEPPLEERLAAVVPRLANPLSADELQTLNSSLPQFITAGVAPVHTLLKIKLDDGGWTDLANEQDQTDLAAIVAEMETDAFQASYRSVREGIDRGYVSINGGFDGAGMSLDNRWATVLLAHARYAWEINGDVAGARQDIDAVLRLAYLYLDHATVNWVSMPHYKIPEVSRLVRDLATTQKGLDGWQPFIQRHMLKAAPRPAEELFAAEIVKVRAYFDSIFVPEEGWLYVPRALNPDYPESFESERGWNILSFLFADRAEADRRFDRFLDCISDRHAYGHLGQFSATLITEDALWSGVTLRQWDQEWNFVWIYMGHLKAATELEGMLTVLALGNYYGDHQEFPATLDQLVPAYLPRLPMDYYVDRPLTYRRTDESYRLYAVGTNGVDDGGAPTPTARIPNGAYDIVYGFDQ